MFRVIPHRFLTEPRAEITADTGATATLRIDGLVCSACAANVRSRLERVPGVRSAAVDLSRGEARVDYDPESSIACALPRAVESAVLFPGLRHLIHRLAYPS